MNRKKINIFQLVVMFIFAFMGLLGFFFFATYKSKEEKNEVKIGQVIIWGTYPKETVNYLLSKIIDKNEKYADVKYVQKKQKDFRIDFLEAIAAGKSPDLLLLSQNNFLQNSKNLYKIPYSYISQRSFKDTYLDAFSIFDSGAGIFAIPFSIDPMVMYYNKTMFNSESIVLPPKEWKDFLKLTSKLTKKDITDKIFKSTISFGESVNVEHFKEIISTLFFQSGNNITFFDKNEKIGMVNFTAKEKNPSSGLVFFNEFSNQLSPSYSWNRTLPNSKDYFIAGNLAVYFGFSSEAKNIRKKNPNLNFDIAEIPSTTGSYNKSVFANVWGLGIVKVSKNILGAYNVAQMFSSDYVQKILSDKIYLPPVKRTLLAKPASDSFMDIFYREALYAKTWIDPDYEKTSKIFKYMLESVKSGSSTPFGAISTAFGEINYLFNK